MNARVLIFDSGLGGMTIVQAIRSLLPQVDLVYFADNKGFPYGSWEKEALKSRLVLLIEKAIEITRPHAVVLACNTASTIVLDLLRARSLLPFIGTVPAIKPAASQSKSKIIGVLGTPGTIKSGYLEGLISEHAVHFRVILQGCQTLASLSENYLKRNFPSLEEIRREIEPVFIEENGQRTDTVVLGCTHYPFLLPLLKKAAPWEVNWIDSAPAIARRVESVLFQKSENQVFPLLSIENNEEKILTSSFVAPRENSIFLTNLALLDSEQKKCYEKFGFFNFFEIPIEE